MGCVSGKALLEKEPVLLLEDRQRRQNIQKTVKAKSQKLTIPIR
jgi:hypothetical protein